MSKTNETILIHDESIFWDYYPIILNESFDEIIDTLSHVENDSNKQEFYF